MVHLSYNVLAVAGVIGHIRVFQGRKQVWEVIFAFHS